MSLVRFADKIPFDLQSLHSIVLILLLKSAIQTTLCRVNFVMSVKLKNIQLSNKSVGPLSVKCWLTNDRELADK